VNAAAAPNQVLLTLGDIRQWEENVRALTVKIDELTSERAAQIQRLEWVARMFPGMVELPSEYTSAAAPEIPQASGDATKGRRPSVLIAWEREILDFVSRFDRGCTYADLRAHLLASPLADDLRRSTKSYERSMHKLAGRGAIERGYGRVFTPEAFVAFEKEARESGVPPVVQPFSRSPMGEAILKIVHAAPGLRNKQIIAELRKSSEFDAALTPNEGTAYNIIARLARRQNIVKSDHGGAFPGPNFPYDLLGLEPNENEAPNGYAAGASEAGEGATSSNDSRGGLHDLLG
jgi:hypothetical protein